MEVLDSIIPRRTRPWVAGAVAGCVVALAITGWIPLFTAAPILLERGAFESDLILLSDVRPGPFGGWATAEAGDARLFLQLPRISGLAGDRVHVEGTIEIGTVPVGGRPHQVIDVASFETVAGSRSAYRRMGNWLRSRVQSVLADGDESSGLLAGFLVGDVSGVSPATQDAMKLAGLSHFVAVSGSNVAIYLGLVAILAVPLGVGVRRRAVVSLAFLPIFVVATRFEASVIRASVMASIVLISRILDIGLEFWQVLSVAIVGLLAFDPWLIRNVGFQLSAAATAGVVIGARWPGIRTWIGRAAAVTVGAQLAVSPILLVHFGNLPLLSPVSNLVAAPLVSGATLAAVPGVLGSQLSMGLARWMAGIVIQIAHAGAAWPQIGWLGLVGVLLGAMFGRWLWRRSAEYVAVIAAVLALLILVSTGDQPSTGSVVVMDVGQGDAILISGGNGHFALVDGGPDEVVLLRRLREYGIEELDLVVVTHGDADHVAGLSGLFGRIRVGQIWEQTEPHRTSASDQFFDLAAKHQVAIGAPPVGESVQFGELTFRVVGPGRRYQSPNDQSIVLLVSGSQRSILLAGDIEAVAQKELPPLRYEILKVPHHGGGTSDREWMSSTWANLALISVGENRYGHPVPWVIEVLEGAGARVARTDLSGSLIVNLNN